MRYRVNYNPSAIDLWKLSMYGIYSSMIGVVNIIFTAAMFSLIFRFWAEINSIYKIILLLGISLFTVIQPIIIYHRAKRQIRIVPSNMVIIFEDSGIHIKTSEKSSKINWNKVKKAIRKRSMIIIFLTNNQGFLITSKMIDGEEMEFYDYLKTKIKSKHK